MSKSSNFKVNVNALSALRLTQINVVPINFNLRPKISNSKKTPKNAYKFFII